MRNGVFNPESTFEDYLALCQERREMRDEAERQGWRRGYEEPPDLEDPESLYWLARIITDSRQAREPKAA
jgi:hypothetical protein